MRRLYSPIPDVSIGSQKALNLNLFVADPCTSAFYLYDLEGRFVSWKLVSSCFYFVVRNAFASGELIETFLYCRHKLNALGHLFERTVVWLDIIDHAFQL